MPRQPFLPSFAHLQYAVGARVLKDRPELASAIGRCIATWSQVDNEMGVLFGTFLGTDSEAAMEVFLTIRRASNQIEALKAASKYYLTEDEKVFFEVMMKLYKSLELQRNALAHGCYGVAANDLDVLLWIEVKHHVHFQTEALTNYKQGVQVPDPHEKLKEHMFVYRLKDLKILENEMDQFWEAALYFNAYLRETMEKPKANHWERINNFPIFKSALQNQ
jgi:hypothetical protein